MSSVQLVGIAINIACIFIGRAIGSKKGRPTLGGVLGLLLGPIGVIIIAVVPRTKELTSQEAAARWRQQNNLLRSAQPPSQSALSPPD